MSASTHFKLLNANDPQFRTLSLEERNDWESLYGPIENNPGAPLYPNNVYKDDFVEETEEEHGGWIIDLSKLPKEATHIKIERF